MLQSMVALLWSTKYFLEYYSVVSFPNSPEKFAGTIHHLKYNISPVSILSISGQGKSISIWLYFVDTGQWKRCVSGRLANYLAWEGGMPLSQAKSSFLNRTTKSSDFCCSERRIIIMFFFSLQQITTPAKTKNGWNYCRVIRWEMARDKHRKLWWLLQSFG